MIVGLAERGVLEVAGADRVAFLQGLVSNDVTLAAPGRAVWAALLTPQGKWLADFFIVADGERLLLDCERAQAPMLVRLLSRYRLRSKVTLADVSDGFHICVGWGQPAPAAGIVFADPRLPEAGWRMLGTEPVVATGTQAQWQVHRITLGLPDGSRDLEAEKSVLLEAGFDALDGVSFGKGCYMGQELTARTKYRGLLKRRLVPVRIEGPVPERGAAITRDGQEVGTLRYGIEGVAMALLRLDAAGDLPLTCGDATIIPMPPAWQLVEAGLAPA